MVLVGPAADLFEQLQDEDSRDLRYSADVTRYPNEGLQLPLLQEPPRLLL